MKYKTTRKAVVNHAGRLVCAGYGDLQNLLSTREPTAYTCGVYGWNFDVYEVNGLTICTGYRGMPGRRANSIREFEAKAEAIRRDYTMKYEDMKAALENLLLEFCAQA